MTHSAIARDMTLAYRWLADQFGPDRYLWPTPAWSWYQRRVLDGQHDAEIVEAMRAADGRGTP